MGFQGPTIVRSVKVLRDTQYRVFDYSSLFEKNGMSNHLHLSGLDIKEYLDLLNSVSLENI